MLLTLDVGNTQTVVGLLDLAASPLRDPSLADRPQRDAAEKVPLAPKLADPVRHWRVATVGERTADEYALLLSQLLGAVALFDRAAVESFSGGSEQLSQRGSRPLGVGSLGVGPLGVGPLGVGPLGVEIEGIAVSSSVPTATAALREMARRWFLVPLVVIEPGVRTGISISYDNPREVGADRIANAVGAFDLYGGPTIVVDLGTATTFDAISERGEYLGGAITPGIEISMDALFFHAAALRRVELREPHHVIGKSTVESIQSGVVYGSVALVDGLCARIEADLGPATIIATGGLAGLISGLSEKILVEEPWLTLHGLRLCYLANAGTDASATGSR